MKLTCRVIMGALLATGALSGAANAQPSFTAEQADAGKALYDEKCEACHGATLVGGIGGGPPLSGSIFFSHWGDGPVSDLFGKIQDTMPADHPGSLGNEEVASLIAYLFQFNGLEAGDKALPEDKEALEEIVLSKPE